MGWCLHWITCLFQAGFTNAVTDALANTVNDGAVCSAVEIKECEPSQSYPPIFTSLLLVLQQKRQKKRQQPLTISLSSNYHSELHCMQSLYRQSSERFSLKIHLSNAKYARLNANGVFTNTNHFANVFFTQSLVSSVSNIARLQQSTRLPQSPNSCNLFTAVSLTAASAA